jgi:hypothetical protein
MLQSHSWSYTSDPAVTDTIPGLALALFLNGGPSFSSGGHIQRTGEAGYLGAFALLDVLKDAETVYHRWR